MAQFLDTNLSEVHWSLESLSVTVEIGRTGSFPAKSGWCSNISPKTQPAAHISTEVLLGGRVARIFSHPPRDRPWLVFKGWNRGDDQHQNR